MYKHIFIFGTALVALWTVSSAVEVAFTPCSNNPETPYSCEVHDVNIEPCPEAATNEPCKFKRKSNANIIFTFTAGHAADTVKGQPFWASPLSDLPLAGMDTNACIATQCPVQANVVQVYNSTIPISKSFPLRNYDIKWKLWDDDDHPTFQCCFVTKIKIVK